MKKIGLLLISTGKYHIFLQPLIDGIEKYFFAGHDIEIYLFSDREIELQKSERINVVRIPTEHKPWPASTLYRYKYFSEAADKITSDFLFYLDVDMAFVGDVGEEILPDESHEFITATLHPGFFRGGGSWETREDSYAYVAPELRIKYYAGGFQGGRTQEYLQACEDMAKCIASDESRGIIPVWNDESMWNCFLASMTPKTLTPEYCQVEEEDKRRRWGTDHFVPRIIALSKDHAAIRS